MYAPPHPEDDYCVDLMEKRTEMKMSMELTFSRQLKAMLKRNSMIKWRRKGKTAFEILFPVYMVIVLILLKSSSGPIEYQEMDEPYSPRNGNAFNNYNHPTSAASSSFPYPVHRPAQSDPYPVTDDDDDDDDDDELLVYPLNEWTNKTIETMKAFYSMQTQMTLKTTFFTSKQEMNDYYVNRTTSNGSDHPHPHPHPHLILGLLFNPNKSTEYTLRLPFEEVPSTNAKYGQPGMCREDRFRVFANKNCPPVRYVASGFTFFQSLIDSALMTTINNMTTLLPEALIKLYPKEKYILVPQTFTAIGPMYLVFAFMPIASVLVGSFVYEKELKIKEGMLMMGMRISVYWMSWIIIEMITSLIITTSMTAIIYSTELIKHDDCGNFFILTLLFSTSMVVFAILLSPFFKKEKIASSVVSLLTVFLGLGHLLKVYLSDYIPKSLIWVLAFASPLGYAMGVENIFNKEMYELNHEEPDLSINGAIFFLSIDIIIYTLFAVYFDFVVPGAYGPRYPFLFCFYPSFWLGSDKQEEIPLIHDPEANPDIEVVSEELRSKEAIKIIDIQKKFGDKEAISKINLSIYEGQITAILGHNGAGKSTLINMMVGSLRPSSGTTLVYGYDVTKPSDIQSVRNMLGVCLQEDILIKELSARDHLDFFAEMKGIPSHLIEKKVNEMLALADLSDDSTKPTEKLSGGQKRKLCICIALISGPKVILLDEPTSGVDAYSRRQIWSLLKKYKENRVIILTTHFMDEADILADRKAIVSKGKLRCVGSSLFLKTKFGIGYHLKLDVSGNSKIDFLTKLITNVIPESRLERSSTFEVSYILPLKSIELFPSLFKQLEESNFDGKPVAQDFGVSMTSLEEVFLKLGDDVGGVTDHSSYGSDGQSRFNLNPYHCQPRFLQSYSAFLKFKASHFFKSFSSMFAIIFFPLTLFLLSYILMAENKNEPSLDPIKLDLKLYEQDKTRSLRYTGQNSTNYTEFDDLLRREGVDPIHVKEPFTLKNLNKGFMAATINTFPNQLNWTWIIDDIELHALPIVQNILTNVYFKGINQNSNQTIQISSEPFHPLLNQIKFDGKTMTFVIMTSVFLSNILAILIVDVVEDREMKIKDFLRISGLSFFAYWLAWFTLHFVILNAVLISMLVFQIFILKLDFLQDIQAASASVIVFIIFIPSTIMFTYVLTHLFDKKDTARNILPTLCYIPSMIMSLAVMLTMAFDRNLSYTLHKIFSFCWPFYIVPGALNEIIMIKLTSQFMPGKSEDYFSEKVLVTYYAGIFHFFLFLILLPIVDSLKSGVPIMVLFGFQNNISKSSIAYADASEDADVISEKQRVDTIFDERLQSTNAIVAVQHLTKEYKSGTPCRKQLIKKAINDLSFVVDSGSIFGLLGPNGAGKTSTIRILTSEERQNSGRVLILGEELKSPFSPIYKKVGFCPQHDAIWKTATMEQHLKLYAAIRGINPNQINHVCEDLMNQLQIIQFSDKKVETLSGGTKRKLCFAISILGNPQLLMLDEPSTGMDPQSKRFLWKTILNIFEGDANRGAILTTHSMEEADALCNRLGIMVNGSMRCIGSLQHLKNKYGEGYILQLKWDSKSISFHEINILVLNIFNAAVVNEEFENQATFTVPQKSLKSLSDSFNALENLKKNNQAIEEYNFSQTTIEQVFINFAKLQQFK